MSKENPLVSVVIVTYKPNLNYISQAIDSIKKQTYKNTEIIIINDKSTDEIEKYFDCLRDRDKSIIYFCNETRNGVATARNQWIFLSNWKYIAMLDDDDFWNDEKKIEKQVKYLEENQEYWLVWVSELLNIYENWKENGKTKYKISNSDIKNHLLEWNQFAQSWVMIRKTILTVSWIYDTSVFTEDYDLWCRIGKYCKICNINSSIAYRIRENSLRHSNIYKWKINALKIAWKYKNIYPNSLKALIIRGIYLIPNKYLKPLVKIKKLFIYLK